MYVAFLLKQKLVFVETDMQQYKKKEIKTGVSQKLDTVSITKTFSLVNLLIGNFLYKNALLCCFWDEDPPCVSPPPFLFFQFLFLLHLSVRCSPLHVLIYIFFHNTSSLSTKKSPIKHHLKQLKTINISSVNSPSRLC